jgi:hypothetical protein
MIYHGNMWFNSNQSNEWKIFSVGSWRKGNCGALGEKDFHYQVNKALICQIFELLNHEIIFVEWTRMMNKLSLIQFLQLSAIKVH